MKYQQRQEILCKEWLSAMDMQFKKLPIFRSSRKPELTLSVTYISLLMKQVLAL